MYNKNECKDRYIKHSQKFSRSDIWYFYTKNFLRLKFFFQFF